MPRRIDGWLTRLTLAAPPGVVESPHPLLIALLIVISGLTLVLTGGRTAPQSVERALPRILVLAWAVSLLLGGTLAGGGLLLRGPLGRSRALAIERAGNTLLAPAAVVYGVVLLQEGGAQAAVAAGLAIALGLASAIAAYTSRPGLRQRLLARQIARDLRETQ